MMRDDQPPGATPNPLIGVPGALPDGAGHVTSAVTGCSPPAQPEVAGPSPPPRPPRSLLLQRVRSQNKSARLVLERRIADTTKHLARCQDDDADADGERYDADAERGPSRSPGDEKAPAAAAGEKEVEEPRDCCGFFDLAWLHAPPFRFTPRLWVDHLGAENFHLYIWIAKDVCWTTLRYWPGEVFGAFAVLWSIYLMRFAVQDRNWHEMYLCVGQMAWLFANFWWMTGELHDSHTPGCEALTCLYPVRQRQSGWLMNAGLIWLGVFFLVIKPLKLLPPPTPESMEKYLRGHGLMPRWPINLVIDNWRSYENIHVFFWLGKDCAWNHFGTFEGNGRMWFTFMVPTLLIAADFSLTSLFRKTTLVEHAHYAAQNCWVLGNMCWAVGEIWGKAYYDSALPDLVEGPIPAAPMPAPAPAPAPALNATSLVLANATEPLGPGAAPAQPRTMTYFEYTVWSGRYWSTWVLLSAYIFIVALYAIWWTAQARGLIPDGDDDSDDEEEDPKTGEKKRAGGHHSHVPRRSAHGSKHARRDDAPQQGASVV